MEKILTISIAAYDIENYIEQTLDSLIDESIINDLEILVIDDGGTDQTLKIAQKYAGRYPQSIFPIHKENGGYGSTINIGIERATGKYFKQLDGDDWFQTENLKNLIAVMKTVSVDCVLTDYIRFYEKSGKVYYESPYSLIEDGEYELDQSGIDSCYNMYMAAFRTKLLQEMPYRLTEHCFYTDNEYVAFPLLSLNTVYVLHKAIYVYRIGAEGQSMNTASIEKHYKEHEAVFQTLLSLYNKIPQEKTINREIFQDLLKIRLDEHYRYLCLLPRSSVAKQEIIRFIRETRSDCPDILDIAERDYKKVRLMVRSHFMAYPYVSWRLKRDWKKNGRL